MKYRTGDMTNYTKAIVSEIVWCRHKNTYANRKGESRETVPGYKVNGIRFQYNLQQRC